MSRCARAHVASACCWAQQPCSNVQSQARLSCGDPGARDQGVQSVHFSRALSMRA